jgi:hypothetical protein
MESHSLKVNAEQMVIERNKLTQFCPGCFADEYGGSWDHVVMGNHCTNCGASGMVSIPKWAVDTIRKNASWVGSRFYPCAEDYEIWEERKALLSTIETFPGRTAFENPNEPGNWSVTQKLPKNRSVMTIVKADSLDKALRKCGLRYVAAADLT